MKKFLKCVLTIVIFSIFLGIVNADEIRVPTLKNGYNSFINYENGIYTYDLLIDNENYITEGGTQENPKYSIVGYEVYEKNGENYTKVSEADVDGAASLGIDSGKSVSLVARAYILNESEERVFSGYSNELVLNHLKPMTPTLSNGYESFTSFEDGIYTYDLAINLKDYTYDEDEEDPKYSIDGYEVYEKNGENYTKVAEAEIGGAAAINFNQGSNKTLVARAYTENSKGERVYSDYSNELVLKDAIIDVNDVIVSLKKILIDPFNELIESYTEEGETPEKLYAAFDKENNKIVIGVENDPETFDFSFVDNTISYKNTEEVTEDLDLDDAMTTFMFTSGMTQAVLDAAGYEKMMVSTDKKFETMEDFVKYGYLEKDKEYEFDGTDEDGHEYTISKTVLEDYRIKLDKNLIDKLMEEYGKEVPDISNDIVPPTLKKVKASDDSITMHVSIEDSTKIENNVCFVMRSEEENGVFLTIDFMGYDCSGSGSVFTDSDLEPGKTYYYKPVVMVNDNSVFGDVIEVSTLPKNYKISVGPKVKAKDGNNNSIELSWNNIDGAESYEILRSEKKTGKYTTIKKGVKTTSYKNTGVTYGKTYYYKVKAIGKNNKKESGIVSAVAKPNKVKNLVIKSASTNNIKISWDKVGVTGYQVQRSTNGKKWSTIKTITKNKTIEFNNTGLKANTKYYYRVRAYKTVSGKKIYGSYSNVVNTKTAPSKSKISVSLRDYNALNVKVGSSKGATRYLVYRSTSKTGKYSKIGEVASGTYKDLELTTGTTYYYKVKACNTKYCSGYSNIASKKVTPKTPSMNLQSPETKVITVTLGEVNGADGYIVERSTSKKGKYTIVKKLTSEDELIFDDATKKGTTYYYKARSYTLVNGKEVYSDYTSIKSRKSN